MASLSDETRHLSLGCFFTAPFFLYGSAVRQAEKQGRQKIFAGQSEKYSFF